MNGREKTIALITRYYDAFNKGDVEGMLACVADNIAHDVNQGERRNGKKMFAEFCAHMSECYAEKLTHIVIMASDDGKNASAEFVVNGTYKKGETGLPTANGQTYVLPAGAFLEVTGDKISRVTTYYNLQDWIKQVEAA
ncbi:MAG: nuclear transport factor 2 family protein [Alphaproteobacteria bacterium]|nr:nuclear transport factor 2 family protein [Alphaproteobacteria bacterium]